MLLYCSIALANVASFAEVREIAKESDFPLRQQIVERINKEGPLKIKWFRSPLELRTVLLDQTLIPILEDYESQIELEIVYVLNQNEAGQFKALAGPAELEEITRQLVLQEYYPDQFYRYLKIRGDVLFRDDWESTIQLLGLSVSRFRSQMQEENIKKLLQEHHNHLEASFSEFYDSPIHINNQPFFNDPASFEESCCNIFQCLWNCLEGEFGEDPLETFTLFRDIFQDCPECRYLALNKCWDCIESLIIVITDVGECILDCIVNPCDFDGEISCQIKDEYCHKTYSMLPTYNPAGPPIPVIFRNATCEKCPIIEDFTNALGDRILSIKSFPRGSDSPIPGVTTIGEIYSQTPTSYKYKFTKNDETIDENTVVVPSNGTQPVTLTLFNIDSYDPEPNDVFVLEYEGMGGYEECFKGKYIINVSCPFVTFSYEDDGFRITLQQDGYPIDYYIDYYITDFEGNLLINSFGTLSQNEETLVQTNFEYDVEYCLNYTVIPATPGGGLGILADCADPICIITEKCELSAFTIDLDYESYMDESAPGENDGKIVLDATGGSGDFVFINLASPDEFGSETFTGLGAGLHCFVAIDLNTGCESDAFCLEIALDCTPDEGPQINNDGQIVGEDPPPGGENDGKPDENGERPEQRPNGDRPGDGNSDADTSSATDDPGNNDGASCLELSSIITHQSGAGLNDGSIQVNPSLGIPPYHFYWADIPGEGINIRSNLAPGEYCITVYADFENGCCTAYECFTVLGVCDVSSIEVPVIDQDSPTSCNSNDGILKIDATQITGGTSPYSFNWSNGSTNSALFGLAAGNYSVTITDDNGCSTTESMVLEALNPLLLNPQVISTTYPDCDGAIELKIQNGIPPYSVTLSLNGQMVNSYEGNSSVFTFDGLCVGNYTITVEDGGGCTATEDVNLEACGFIVIDDPVITNSIGCQNSAGEPYTTGSIDFGTSTPETGLPPYTYAWSNGANTLSISDLAVGQYFLTITDNGGCSTVYSYLIGTENSVNEFSVSIVDIQHDMQNNCEGSITAHIYYTGNSGYINVDILPGFQSFELPKLGSAIDEEVTFTGLCAGEYTIVAATQEGEPAIVACEIEQQTTVIACPDFQILTEPEIINPSNCNANDGSITYSSANPSGGTPPYNWIWSNATNSEYSIDNLETGIYSLTVVDANGCMIEKTFDLTVPNDAGYTELQIVQQPINGCDGEILVTGIPGVSLTLILPNGQDVQGVINILNQATFDDLCVGDYTLTATDANGCEEIIEFNLAGCDPITSLGTVDANPPLNCGDANGSIRFITTPSGGMAPYTYLATDENGNTYSPQPGSNIINNLPSSMYTITVTDALDCSAEFMIELLSTGEPELAASEVEPECEDEANGEILLFITNNGSGTVNNTFSIVPTLPTVQINEDNTSAEITGLETGNYNVVVTTDNGCSSTFPFFVDEILSTGVFQFTSTPTVSTSCPFQATGGVSISVAGGNPGYSLRLKNVNNPQSVFYTPAIGPEPYTANFENIPAGTYTLRAKDDCDREIFYPEQITINAFPAMNIELNALSECQEGLVSTDLVVQGPGTAVEFEWSNGATTQNLQNVQPGTYSVTVTDANGCTESAQVTLEAYIEVSTELRREFNVCWYEGRVVGAGLLEIRIENGLPIPGVGFEYDMTGPDGYNQSGSTTDRDLEFANILEGGEFTLEVTDKCATYTFTFNLANQVIMADDISTGAFPQCIAQEECDGRLLEFPAGLATPDKPAQVSGLGDVWIEINNDCTYEVLCRNGGYPSSLVEYQFTGITGTGETLSPYYQGSYDPENPDDAICEELTFCKVNVNIVDAVYGYSVQGTEYRETDRVSRPELLTEETYVSNQGAEYLVCDWSTEDLFVVYCSGEIIYQSCVPICSGSNQTLTSQLDADNCQMIYTCTTTDDEGNTTASTQVEDIPTQNCFYYNPSGPSIWTEIEICTAGESITVLNENVGHQEETPEEAEMCCVAYGFRCPYALLPDLPADSRNELTGEPFEIEKSFETKIFPNPMNDQFTVEYHVEKATKTTVELLSLTGQVIQKIVVDSHTGWNNLEFNVDHQTSSGILFLRIQNGNDDTELHKVVRMK